MAYALDSTNVIGHAYAMPDDAPKRPRGRPRIHADTKAADAARSVAHRRAKRQGMHERIVHLDDATSARADALMQARESPSFGALVSALVNEESERKSVADVERPP